MTTPPSRRVSEIEIGDRCRLALTHLRMLAESNGNAITATDIWTIAHAWSNGSDADAFHNALDEVLIRRARALNS
jgi:hypothetical protein